MGKVIIVEGKTDKERLEEILNEPVDIVCSYGTISYEKLEKWSTLFEDSEIYVLVDADEPGDKLRKQLNQEIPNVKHLYTHRMYREVATTPLDVIANVLSRAHFEIKEVPMETV